MIFMISTWVTYLKTIKEMSLVQCLITWLVKSGKLIIPGADMLPRLIITTLTPFSLHSTNLDDCDDVERGSPTPGRYNHIYLIIFCHNFPQFINCL